MTVGLLLVRAGCFAQGVLDEVGLIETFVTVMCKNTVLATSAGAVSFQVKFAAQIS